MRRDDSYARAEFYDVEVAREIPPYESDLGALIEAEEETRFRLRCDSHVTRVDCAAARRDTVPEQRSDSSPNCGMAERSGDANFGVVQDRAHDLAP